MKVKELFEAKVSEGWDGFNTPSVDKTHRDKFINDVKSILDQWNRRKGSSGLNRKVQSPWDRGGWALELSKLVREYEKAEKNAQSEYRDAMYDYKMSGHH